jgi:prephenate dehydratase
VLGHTGSLSQSREWLREHAPQAEIRIVDSHSLGAAREVLASRGDIAAVGSTDLAAETGLEILARDIDGGSVGFYWALSGTPHADPRPDRVVVSGRVRDGGGLSDLVCGLRDAGYRLVSLSQTPSGEGLFHDGCVAYFNGEGTLDAVHDAVGRVAGMRLAGAYTTTPAAP